MTFFSPLPYSWLPDWSVAARLNAELQSALRPAWEALPVPVPEPLPPLEADYRAVPVPENLRGRRVELIVEASDTGAVRAALGGETEALVLDYDDTFSPTTANLRAADANLRAALGTDMPLLVRPRPLYQVTGREVTGGEVAAWRDLAAALTAHPQRQPHLYIPKLESPAQAHLWEEALTLCETFLKLPHRSVRTCLQIETYPGLLNADHLLQALGGRSYGLNAGRWDYVFSLLKTRLAHSPLPVPPREALGMDQPAMQAYARQIVQVCKRRGAQAIGGTAAVAPDPRTPGPALNLVREDKRREARQGFVAAWAGLPELQAAARAGLEAGENETEKGPPVPVTVADLTDLPPASSLAVSALRDALGLALAVFAAWFEGRGVVVRGGRIEDTATAELARTQVWQWVRCRAPLDDGTVLTPERYLQEREVLAATGTPAARLLDRLTLAQDCAAYFPALALTLTH